jgi:hypothetical protein
MMQPFHCRVRQEQPQRHSQLNETLCKEHQRPQKEHAGAQYEQSTDQYTPSTLEVQNWFPARLFRGLSMMLESDHEFL